MPRKKKMPELSLDDLSEIHSIARAAIGNTEINHADAKDIEQELALHLIHKMKLFRKGKKCVWEAFRGVVLRQRMLEIFRERSRPSARTTSPYLLKSLDEEIQGDDAFLTLSDCINEDGLPADGTEKSEQPELELRIDMQIFIAALPLKLRKVCIELQTQSVSSTSKALHLHRSDIYRRIEKIRVLMVKAGLDIYL